MRQDLSTQQESVLTEPTVLLPEIRPAGRGGRTATGGGGVGRSAGGGPRIGDTPP